MTKRRAREVFFFSVNQNTTVTLCYSDAIVVVGPGCRNAMSEKIQDIISWIIGRHLLNVLNWEDRAKFHMFERNLACLNCDASVQARAVDYRMYVLLLL
jgi:hypothetical protein